MPLYFFDFHDSGRHSFDDVGQEFPDIGRARDEAINTLFDAAWDLRSAGDRRDCISNVSDESGRIVFRGGSGNLHSGAEWSFCLTVARMAADQEQ